MCNTMAVAPIAAATLLPPEAAEAAAPLAALAPAVEDNLRRHVLAPWFPRAVDRGQGGGFHQNYAADWAPLPDDIRSIVYQSRLTWVAAQAMRRFPAEADTWRAHVRHGLDILTTRLWDKENGGWYWEVGAGKDSAPGRGGEKHAYGISFALYALAAAHQATGDPRALKFAREGFGWLDSHAHDTAHGGYHEQIARTGARLTAASGQSDDNDPIGTRYGLRSMNTHIHLLEAFAALHEVWPDPTLSARLAEVFALVRDRVAAPEGRLHLYLQPDWTPLAGVVSFGHDVETAYLLDEAAHVLKVSPAERAKTDTVARRLVDHALAHGWDSEHGGFYDEGDPATGKVLKPRKVWWTQAEGLNALLLLHRRHGSSTPRYADAFRRQWEFIERYQVDMVHTGWRRDVAASGAPDPKQTKSDAWTDPYHQGRALLNVSAALRSLT